VKTYTEQDLREALAALAPTDTPPVDMWSRVRSRIARRRRMRLALAAGGLAAATTIALVAWPGAGRDSVGPSEGAKSMVVTLGLRGSPSHRVTAATLHVLRKRLDGLGISGATISVHNKSFAVTVPSTDLAKLNGLADRGALQLRQVLQVASRSEITASLSVGTAPDLSHAESLFARSTCNEPSNRPRRHPAALAPADYLVACSVDSASIYLLGPSPIRTADVASADAQTGTTGAWFVDVSLTQAGAEEWKNLTQTAAQQPFMPQCRPPSGCNGIGVVVDGHIVSVPVVQGGTGLNGGRLQISVRSQEEARALATDLTHPLPVDLNYLSVGPAS
jgi:preprotein translocase subunit SecD